MGLLSKQQHMKQPSDLTQKSQHKTQIPWLNALLAEIYLKFNHNLRKNNNEKQMNFSFCSFVLLGEKFSP